MNGKATMKCELTSFNMNVEAGAATVEMFVEGDIVIAFPPSRYALAYRGEDARMHRQVISFSSARIVTDRAMLQLVDTGKRESEMRPDASAQLDVVKEWLKRDNVQPPDFVRKALGIDFTATRSWPKPSPPAADRWKRRAIACWPTCCAALRKIERGRYL